MRPVDICVLSKYPDIFQGFRESVDKDAPDCRKIVLWDAGEWEVARTSKVVSPIHSTLPNGDTCGNRWTEVWKYEPFHMAANANEVWREADLDHDILYAGDDVRFIEPNTVKRLQEAAYSDKTIGILAPWISNTNLGMSQLRHYFWKGYVAFPLVYIRRDLLNVIGFLEERFWGYGWDDVDFCFRARKAGFRVGVVSDIVIEHDIGKHFGKTFQRVTAGDDGIIWNQNEANQKLFAEKWGLPNDQKVIWDAIESA